MLEWVEGELRCPTCHRETSEGRPVVDVTCPDCSHPFALVSGKWAPAKLVKIQEMFAVRQAFPPAEALAWLRCALYHWESYTWWCLSREDCPRSAPRVPGSLQELKGAIQRHQESSKEGQTPMEVDEGGSEPPEETMEPEAPSEDRVKLLQDLTSELDSSEVLEALKGAVRKVYGDDWSNRIGELSLAVAEPVCRTLRLHYVTGVRDMKLLEVELRKYLAYFGEVEYRSELLQAWEDCVLDRDPLPKRNTMVADAPTSMENQVEALGLKLAVQIAGV